MPARAPRRLPLRTWLLLLIALALVAMAALAALAFVAIRDARSDDLHMRMDAQLADISSRLSYATTGAADLATLIAAVDLPQENCGEALARLHRRMDRYEVIALADENGDTLCSSPPRRPAPNISDRPWFERLLATRAPVVGGYQVSRTTGAPDMVIAAPIEEGPAVLVGAGLRLDWLSAFIAEVGLPPDAVAGVLDAERRVVARFPEADQWVGETPTRSGARWIEKGGSLRGVATGFDGIERFFAGRWHEIHGSRFFVYVGHPSGEIFDTARAVGFRQLMLAMAAAVLLGLLAWLVLRRHVVRPLQQASAYAAAVENGARPDPRDTHSRVAEVARLGDALGAMSVALRRQERDMGRACRLARLGWWRAWPESDRVDCSPEMREILGLAPEETRVRMARIARAVEAEDRPAFRALFAELPRDRPNRAEFRLRRPDGQLRHVLAEMSVGDPAGDGALEGICQDVTERRELEERVRLARRLDSLGKLTGGIAHDFNNVLTVVLGNCEMLEARLAPDDPMRRVAALARRAAERGVTVTRRLLSFARRRRLAPADVDAGELISDIATLLAATLGERAELHVERAEEDCLIRVDEGEMEHALLNLAINARDAMPEGGRITLSAAPRRVGCGALNDAAGAPVPPGDYVEVAVADEGAGMPEAARDRVLEPFFTTKTGDEGSGLGLSIVYGFTRQSQGYLLIDSKPGRGARVSLLLPRRSAEGREEAEIPSTAVALAAPDPIIVVSGTELLRDLICNQLAALGCTAAPACDAAGGMAALEHRERVALMVIELPWREARALRDQVRARAPDLPVVLVCGGPEEEAALRDGGALLLRKPFGRRDLDQIIREALGAA